MNGEAQTVKPALDSDRYYELVAHGGSAIIGSVEERTEHSIELRDWHLADDDLIAKHRPFAVRGGSINTGPWRVESTVTPYFTFHLPGGWPERQEAMAIKLAALLNGESL